MTSPWLLPAEVLIPPGPRGILYNIPVWRRHLLMPLSSPPSILGPQSENIPFFSSRLEIKYWPLSATVSFSNSLAHNSASGLKLSDLLWSVMYMSLNLCCFPRIRLPFSHVLYLFTRGTVYFKFLDPFLALSGFSSYLTGYFLYLACIQFGIFISLFLFSFRL